MQQQAADETSEAKQQIAMLQYIQGSNRSNWVLKRHNINSIFKQKQQLVSFYQIKLLCVKDIVWKLSIILCWRI